MEEKTTTAIRASYEAARLTVLSAYLSHPDRFHPAFVYAWNVRMPARGLSRQSHFADAFRIGVREVDTVHRVVTQLVEQDRLERLAYDRLLAHPVLQGSENVAAILRYYVLKGEFIGDTGIVLRALEANLPDSVRLDRPFDTDEIDFT